MPTPIRSHSPHVSSDHSLRQSLEDGAASPRSLGGRAFSASRDERFLNLPSVRTGTSQSSTPSSAFSRSRRPSFDKQGLFEALANLLVSSASTRGNLSEVEHYNGSSQPVWPPSAGLRMQYPAVIAANDRDIMVQGAGDTESLPRAANTSTSRRLPSPANWRGSSGTSAVWRCRLPCPIANRQRNLLVTQHSTILRSFLKAA
jgi:hypothetical protein